MTTVQFLKKEDLYEEAKQNLIDYRPELNLEGDNKSLARKINKTGLMGCFRWDKTPEGHLFWWTVNLKYLKLKQ